MSEAFHLLGSHGGQALSTLLRREALRALFFYYDFADHREPTLRLMAKYAEIPMSLADHASFG